MGSALVDASPWEAQRHTMPATRKRHRSEPTPPVKVDEQRSTFSFFLHTQRLLERSTAGGCTLSNWKSGRTVLIGVVAGAVHWDKVRCAGNHPVVPKDEENPDCRGCDWQCGCMSYEPIRTGTCEVCGMEAYYVKDRAVTSHV